MTKDKSKYMECSCYSNMMYRKGKDNKVQSAFLNTGKRESFLPGEALRYKLTTCAASDSHSYAIKILRFHTLSGKRNRNFGIFQYLKLLEITFLAPTFDKFVDIKVF